MNEQKTLTKTFDAQIKCSECNSGAGLFSLRYVSYKGQKAIIIECSNCHRNVEYRFDNLQTIELAPKLAGVN
jgi:transcription elongation factor Elf1